MIDALLMISLCLTSIFLILLVLIQRGRGGGLAGAFGGLGGQSAFGTKAGDLFTRVTIVVATVWILLCAVSVKYFSDANRGMVGNLGTSAPPPISGGAAPSADAKPGAAGGQATQDTATPPKADGPNMPQQTTEPPAGSGGADEKPAADAPAADKPATDAPADSN